MMLLVIICKSMPKVSEVQAECDRVLTQVTSGRGSATPTTLDKQLLIGTAVRKDKCNLPWQVVFVFFDRLYFSFFYCNVRDKRNTGKKETPHASYNSEPGSYM